MVMLTTSEPPDLTLTSPSAPLRPFPARTPKPASKPRAAAETSTSSFAASTKRDRRQIKHSLLLSRLHDSSATSRVTKPSQRKKPALTPTTSTNKSLLAKKSRASRRRSNAAPHVSLANLGDALPVEEDLTDGKNTRTAPQSSRQKSIPIGQVSLKPGKGVRRRVQGVERLERARWEQNMSNLMAAATPVEAGHMSQEDAVAGSGSTVEDVRAKRWEALRKHIEGSMDQAG